MKRRKENADRRRSVPLLLAGLLALSLLCRPAALAADLPSPEREAAVIGEAEVPLIEDPEDGAGAGDTVLLPAAGILAAAGVAVCAAAAVRRRSGRSR